MQSLVVKTIDGWDVDEIYVGASGNFTIERLLAPRGRRLWSNDVQIYSCAIGWRLAGQDFRLEVRPDFQDEWGWLADSMTTPTGKLATIMLASTMMQGAGSGNAYYSRIRRAYRAQWPRLFAETCQTIDSVGVELAGFHAGDCVDWLTEIPADQGFAVFPPFFAGDYEAMFRGLGKVFDWDEPEYPEFDHERAELMIERMRGIKRWLYGSNVRWPQLEDHLTGIVQTTNRGVPIYCYADDGRPRGVVRPAQHIDALLIPHLGPDDELGEELNIIPLTDGQFSLLRSRYMNRHIRPGQASAAYGVHVDGILVGAYAITTAPTLAHYERHMPTPTVYLLSDFPVSGTRYDRLAKLVLYAALSEESKALIELVGRKRFRSMATTAFTDNPVSMKYRGVFRLLSRKDSTDPLYQYQLQYGRELGQWNLTEGMDEWRWKHSK